jgi:hypothetical protein
MEIKDKSPLKSNPLLKSKEKPQTTNNTNVFITDNQIITKTVLLVA